MNKSLLIVIIVLAALALGIGGGYVVSRALPAPLAQGIDEEGSSSLYAPGTSPQVTPGPDDTEDEDDEDGIPLPKLDPRQLDGNRMPELLEKFGGRMNMHKWMEKGFIPPGLLDENSEWPEEWRYWGPGGMGPWGDDFEVTGERITLEQALSLAQEYATGRGENLRVARMYEFEKVFYAVVEETDTGMGAFQLIIQPVSGNVRFETGPGMAWNTKYGRRAMMDNEIPENALTMKAAAMQAQQALEEKSAQLTIDPDGVAFNGYYTFEYLVDGEISGLISVNAEDGDYWFHNWLGNFISREDITE